MKRTIALLGSSFGKQTSGSPRTLVNNFFSIRKFGINSSNTSPSGEDVNIELSPLYPKIKTTRLFTLLYSGQIFSDLALSDPTLQRVKIILNDALFLGVDKPSKRFIEEDIKTRRENIPLTPVIELISYDEKEIASLDNQLQIYQKATRELSDREKWDYSNTLVKKINHSLEIGEIRRVDPYLRVLTNTLRSLGVESVDDNPTICYLMNKRLLHDAEKEFLKSNEELIQILKTMPQDVFDKDKDVNRKKASESLKAEQYGKLLIGTFQFKKAIYMLKLAAEVYDIILDKHRNHFSSKEIEIMKSDRERRYYCLIELHAFISSLASEYSTVCRQDSKTYYADDGDALYRLLTTDYGIQARKEGKIKPAFRKEASLNAFAASKYIRHLKDKSPNIEKRFPMIKIIGLNASRSLMPHRFRNLVWVLALIALIFLAYLVVQHIMNIREANKEIEKMKAERRQEMISILKPKNKQEEDDEL